MNVVRSVLAFALVLAAPAFADTWRQERYVNVVDNVAATLVADVRHDRILSLLPGGDPFSYPQARYTVMAMPMTGAPGWAPLEVAGTAPRRPSEWLVADDPGRDRMILLGDFDTNAPGLEAWALELKGAPSWHMLLPAGPAPAVRKSAGATYDPLGDRVLLFGGAIENDPTNELWELRFTPNLEWKRIDAAGLVAPKLIRPLMTFDAPRSRLVVLQPPNTQFLPATPAQAWLLDCSTDPPAWDVQVPSGPQPTASQFTQRAVRDSTRGYLIVGGGLTGPDYWGLRLSDLLWVAYGPLAPGTKPIASRGTLVFDERRTNILAFGSAVDALGYRLLDPAIVWTPLRIPGARPGNALDFSPEPDGRGGLVLGNGWTQRIVPYANGYGAEESVDNDFPAGAVSVVRDSRAHLDLVLGKVNSSADTMSVFAMNESRQGGWRYVPVPGSKPPYRASPMVAYDSTSGTTYMYGGQKGSGVIGDVWSFHIDGAGVGQWSNLSTAGGPVGFRGGMIVDATRHRLILFAISNLTVPSSIVWTFNFTSPSWEAWSPTGPIPPTRVDPAIAYDSRRDRMLIQGGQVKNGNNTGLKDAYALDLSSRTWTQLPDAPVTHDQPSFGFYDSEHDEFVTLSDPLQILAFDFAPTIQVASPSPLAGAPAGRVIVPLSITNGLKKDAPCAYEVTASRAWPGLPRAGSLQVVTTPVTTLDLQVDVPDSAAAGPQDLLVVVRALDGSGVNDTTNVRIEVAALPDPLLACGGDVTWVPGTDAPVDYVIENQSPAAGPVTYRLTVDRAWPGMPISGETQLPGAGSALLALTVPVPDTAAVGAVVAHLVVAPKALPSDRSECYRHLHDATTPTLLSMIESRVAADGSKVSLRWWSGSAALASVRIERRQENGAFEPLAVVEGDAEGFVAYEDDAVPGAGRYAYRAGRANGASVEWSPEFWVDVPAAPLAFASGSIVRGPFEVAFTAPGIAPATVEAFDVRGRRIASKRIESPVPGANRVLLAGPRASGVYFLRLVQGDREVHAKIVLLAGS